MLRLCPFLSARGAPAVPLTEEQRAERAERRAEHERKRAEDNARKHEVWVRRWTEAIPLTSSSPSPIVTYLKGRSVEPQRDVFRQTTFTIPRQQAYALGMMAEIVDAATGKPFAFHVTYVSNGGGKTIWREDTDRITPGMTSEKGVGVIKLIAGAGDAGRSLCIGEGIETALSFTHLVEAKGATIWSAVNAAKNMAKLDALDSRRHHDRRRRRTVRGR